MFSTGNVMFSTGSVTTFLVITLQLEKPHRRKYLLISGIKKAIYGMSVDSSFYRYLSLYILPHALADILGRSLDTPGEFIFTIEEILLLFFFIIIPRSTSLIPTQYQQDRYRISSSIQSVTTWTETHVAHSVTPPTSL